MLKRDINFYLNNYYTEYEMTPLHKAALSGDMDAVKKILRSNPKQYIKTTKPSGLMHPDDYENRLLGGATALHYALLRNQYDVAELLLKHPACKEIINITDENHISILELISMLPDKEKALELSKLAINIEGIDINHQGNKHETALFKACTSKNIELARLLLANNADPNLTGGDDYHTPLQELALRLQESSDPNEIKTINEMIMLLLDHGADPKIRDGKGKTFFDYVMENSSLLDQKIDNEIKKKLSSSWKSSTPEEIKKAADIFSQTAPLTLARPRSADQSPSLNNTALLVQLKRERRKSANSDYDCTVLDNRDQLETFLNLAKLRFQATGEPFQTQFIMQPRGGADQVHVANGQLNFDANGNVTVFWMDTIGHNDRYTKNVNREIGELIHKHIPAATLYTVDMKIQATDSGCHNFSMYISEQLSAAASKGKDLYRDLNTIYQRTKKDEDGFRIIPWRKCPAYTGVPRIIQSASKPQERMSKKRRQDQEPINKEGQNYQQAMRASFGKREGKLVNLTYDTKRNKFGKYLRETLERDYDTDALKQRRFAGYTDLASRIPVEALSESLNIRLEKEGDERWEISIPQEHCGKHISPILRGTIEELKQQLNDAYAKLSTDESAFKGPNLLYQYAAIRTASSLVNSLTLEEEKTVKPDEESHSRTHLIRNPRGQFQTSEATVAAPAPNSADESSGPSIPGKRI